MQESDPRNRPREPVPWDDSLARRFRFACRPGCGMCCYVSPRLTPSDREGIGQQRRPVPLVPAGPGRWRIPERATGGACAMLDGDRCQIHLQRPGVCAIYPVTLYAGRGRWQASIVLSCPGVDLEPLRQGGDPREGPSSPPADSLRREIDRARWIATSPAMCRAFRGAALRRSHSLRRLLGRQPLWAEVDSARSALLRMLPILPAHPEEAEPLPDVREGAEYLPLVAAPAARPIALATDGGVPTVFELDPFGRLTLRGRYRPLDRIPAPDGAAREWLAGYQGYWLDRDAFWDGLVAGAEGCPGAVPGPLEAGQMTLRKIAATVLLRAAILAQHRGTTGTLTDTDAIVDGIRATDADLIDAGGYGAVEP
ncbi:MAG: YkgJ family cysteine cluster protein [Thermoplasmata archaeon]